MKKLIYITGLLALISSCKKYEDGGIKNKKVEKKILGFKRICSYKINGVESIEQLQNHYGSQDFFFSFQNSDILSNPFNNTKITLYLNNKPYSNQDSCYLFGYWNFENDFDSITIALHPKLDSCTQAYEIPIASTKWKINKLTKKELFLQTSYKSNLHELFYESIQ